MNERKQALIQEMLEMQQKFMAYEKSGQFNAEEYYVGEWKEYRDHYTQIAAEVREIASKEANFWK